MLPFTHDQFLDVFAAYNAAVWPAAWVAYGLAAGILVAAMRGDGRWVAAQLAALWLWTGVVYHWGFFTAINGAAWGFGALFVAQGLLWLQLAARGRWQFRRTQGVAASFGGLLVAYATLAYPLIGLLAGPGYPRVPLFGITPCPVTLFTIGVLLMSERPVPRRLLVVPAIWAVIGGSAAFLLHVPQDWVLLVSVLAVFVLASRWRRSATRSTAAAG